MHGSDLRQEERARERTTTQRCFAQQLPLSPFILIKKFPINSPKILKPSSSYSPCCLPLNTWVSPKSLVPLAAFVAILLSPVPAKDGLLSGFPGIESVPGPKLPEIEFLNRFNEENQKKYAEADARFKSSPLLKQLLERSKQNKERTSKKFKTSTAYEEQMGVGLFGRGDVTRRKEFIAT
ncbi:uncharacterized protein LOC120194731 [Hibiscus syriacus]|uniref:uncharacterized protein LOC120194731 n=1 Tax=Hibiscus syriacus TaxID=106335 RepID=UPI001921D335|nr:uncharacterized protein LOC120194731 [Hibiscus syriacus]